MTTEVRKDVTAIAAGEDLIAADRLFKAVQVNGTIASTNANAIGLLASKGKSGEAVSVAYEGEMKAYVGSGGVTAGARVIVTTSGFLATAADSRSNCGRALESANSGDLFRGLFSFISNT